VPTRSEGVSEGMKYKGQQRDGGRESGMYNNEMVMSEVNRVG